jgi:hypothetical protein
MDTKSAVVYDYAQSGRATARVSTVVVLGIGIFMLLLGLSVLLLPKTSGNYLSAIILIPTGGWMFLNGLHLRRDRHAFTTRYVLSDEGVDISAMDLPRKTLAWSQVSSGYHSRLLRYFSLEAADIQPRVVLVYGAPPKANAMAGQLKYRQTRDLLSQKLDGRFISGWL